jgi:hypothetical protein
MDEFEINIESYQFHLPIAIDNAPLYWRYYDDNGKLNIKKI